MNLKFLVLVSVLFVGFSASADEKQWQLKSLMHVFLNEMEKLCAHVVSEQAINSDLAKKQISSSLTVLENKVRSAPEAFKENPGFRVVFSLLADHLVKTKAVFDKGEFEYARMRINGTTALCAACHLQTPMIALLYYLALVERNLSPTYFYSVGDVYLKECVVRYPKRAFTKRCFEAYRDGMAERFFGRTIPEPFQQSIDAMKDYL